MLVEDLNGRVSIDSTTLYLARASKANTSELIVAAALCGHGLAWVPLDLVQEHIAASRLMSVLDEWAITFAGYHAYYASRHASPALMLVVEALRPLENR